MRSNREPPERSGCICRSASRSCPATASSSASRVRVSRSAVARSSTSIRSFRRRRRNPIATSSGWSVTGRADVDHLRRLTGELRAPDVGRWAVDPAALAATRRTPRGRGGRRGSRTRDCSTRRVRASRARGARRHHHRWGTGPAAGSTDVLADSDLVARLEADPFAPPDLDDADPAEIRELVRRRACAGRWCGLRRERHRRGGRVVARLLADQPDGITVAEARDAWGTTQVRVPLITRLDETGVTRRRGDLRIAGPRLPQG